MKQAIAIINEVENQRPYKQPGNRDSYSQYNEGWSDACDEIRQQLQKALDNSSPEVSGMKWVKASERLPETSNVTARYIDNKKPFVGDILEFFSFYTQMPFEIEWLDEGK